MPRLVASRTTRRVLGSVLGVAVFGTALMGFAHTPPGRPLLNWMGLSMKGAGCPLGYDAQASVQSKEAARRGFAAAHRGAEPARVRPALGFLLEGTTRAQVLAWADEHGVRCTTPRTGADLDCEQVPATLLPLPGRQVAVGNLWLHFGAGDTLVSVIALSRSSEAAALLASYVAVNEALTQQAGPPTRRDAQQDADWLSGGLLRQTSTEYRFQDFYALARATNMGDGFLLTEEYRALPPPTLPPRG
ncbi:hypothetical protein [Melittangium boletus]|uniref:hypothetical protein n=1 Tax=Melittangium boletus TaxID=83453 RepID=UPI003DA2853A